MMSQILTTIAVVCATAMGPLHAQTARENARPGGSGDATVGLSSSLAEANPSNQFSTPDLEDLRTQLLSLEDTMEQFATLAPPGLLDNDSLQQAKTQIQQMPYQSLNALRRGLNPSGIKSRLTGPRQQIKSYIEARSGASVGGSAKARAMAAVPGQFPTPSGFCNTSMASSPLGNVSQSGYGATGGAGSATSASTGSIDPGSNQQLQYQVDPSTNLITRIPSDVILGYDATRFIADTIRDFSQDACKEDILGENASLACIPLDALAVIADAIDEAIHFCDDDLTGSVIDTSYTGIADVYANLLTIGKSLDSHVTTANTDVDTNITAANTDIDTNIKAANTDIDNKITTQVQAAVTSLQATQAANQALNMQLAIESELLQAGSGGLGSFELPAAYGGYLELTRQIVVNTIQKFQAAGQSVGSAQTSLSLGDAALATNDYKSAFTYYKNAYRLAVQ